MTKGLMELIDFYRNVGQRLIACFGNKIRVVRVYSFRLKKSSPGTCNGLKGKLFITASRKSVRVALCK